MRLFHTSENIYARGDLVSPGNWGRFHKNIQKSILPEKCLEDVRKKYYPNYPSRLNSCFYFRNKIAVAAYLEIILGKPKRLVYEVEIVDRSAKKFFGNISYTGRMTVCPTTKQSLMQLARSYWKEDLSAMLDSYVVEGITDSSLRVISKPVDMSAEIIWVKQNI